MQTSPINNFWQFDAAYWFQKLNSSEKGLSKTEADKILSESGHIRKNKSVFRKEAISFYRTIQKSIDVITYWSSHTIGISWGHLRCIYYSLHRFIYWIA